MRSATPGARSPPPIRRSWCSTASRSSRPSSRTTVESSRSISASQARIGCPRGRSSTRQVRMIARRSVVRLRDRNVTRSRVARSIQWTSSMTSTVGPASDSAPSSPSMRSNSRAWPRPDGSVPGAGSAICGACPSVGQLRDDRREVAPRGPQQALQRLRRDGAREPAQRRGDGEIGKPAGPDVETLADEDQRSLPACRVRRLLHEAGLADPCLAPHDDEPRGRPPRSRRSPEPGWRRHRRDRRASDSRRGWAWQRWYGGTQGPRARAEGAAPIGTAPRSSAGRVRAARCTARVGDHCGDAGAVRAAGSTEA